MASLYIEMAPGNEVFRMVDIAVKATEARPGAQIVEREFGMFEVHSRSQAEVLEAGRVVLDRLGLEVADRVKPEMASVQVITNVDPYQAQLLNRFRRGSMLVPGETMLVLECAPAAYINFACNEAEKGASIKIDARFFGRPLWPHVAVGHRSRRSTPPARRPSALLRRWKASRADSRKVIMSKTFYTERDIADLAARGVTSLEVNDDVVLTDLARDEALKRGVALTRPKAEQPADAAEAELVHRVKAAVIARLGTEVDAAVLDAAINRAMKGGSD